MEHQAINQPSSQATATLNIPRLLKLSEVKMYTRMSTSTIYDISDKKSKRYDPTFPVRVKTRSGSVFWVADEIAEWVNAQIANRSA